LIRVVVGCNQDFVSCRTTSSQGKRDCFIRLFLYGIEPEQLPHIIQLSKNFSDEPLLGSPASSSTPFTTATPSILVVPISEKLTKSN
jgi:hypothetical protein